MMEVGLCQLIFQVSLSQDVFGKLEIEGLHLTFLLMGDPCQNSCVVRFHPAYIKEV